LFECALAQLYKQSDGSETYRGGPAYFMHFGLGWRVMPVIYSGLLLITVGFGFNAVQTYSVTNSIESAFAIPTWQSGIVLTAVMAIILFGGIRRLAAVSQVIVPIMVAGYFALAIGILVANISEVPGALALIFKSAFGLEHMVGGGVAAAIMQGARRGLFSNETSWHHSKCSRNIRCPTSDITGFGAKFECLYRYNCTVHLYRAHHLTVLLVPT